MRKVYPFNSAEEFRLAGQMMAICVFSIGVLIVAALLLIAALNGPYMHDEESYIAGAYFARDYALYGDFVFLQPPYFAWVFGTVFELVDSNFFLTARLVVFALSLFSVTIVYFLARLISGSKLVGGCAVALFMCSTVLMPAFGWARNDILAIFFSLLAMFAFVMGDRADKSCAVLLKVLAGVAAGCAVGTKVSYVFLPAALFMVEGARYILKSGREISVTKVSALSVGLILAVIPILSLAVLHQSGFFYGVYEHHIIAPPDWTSQLGRAYKINTRAAVMDWLSFVRRDVSMGAAVFIGYGALHTLVYHSKRFKQEYSINGDKALFLVLVILAIPLTLVTRPIHIHYVQPLIPLLIFAAVSHAKAINAAADKPEGLFGQRFFLVMTALVCIPGFTLLLGKALDGSEVKRMARVSAEIRAVLGDTPGPIATVSPIRVIDAGAQPYTEFSAGPFFYRSAHLLPADRVLALKGASPETLAGLLTDKPPSAILVGYESSRGDIDGGLIRYAETNGFERVEIDKGRAYLYVRRGK